MDVPINVTVEDKVFKTTKNTLLLSGFFRSMMEIEPESTNIIVNDRSKKTFKHVLSYLRDNQYPFPRKYKSELDFYDIDYNEKTLYDPYKTINDNLINCFSKLYDLDRDNVRAEMKWRDGKDLYSCRVCGREKKNGYMYCEKHICKYKDCLRPASSKKNYCTLHYSS